MTKKNISAIIMPATASLGLKKRSCSPTSSCNGLSLRHPAPRVLGIDDFVIPEQKVKLVAPPSAGQGNPGPSPRDS